MSRKVSTAPLTAFPGQIFCSVGIGCAYSTLDLGMVVPYTNALSFYAKPF